MMFGRDYVNETHVGDPGNPDVKMKITSVKLNEDQHYYSLDIKYEMETSSEIREFHLPKVRLPLKNDYFWVGTNYTGRYLLDCEVDVGFGTTKLNPDDKDKFYYERVIKTKTKEMTLEEIEKKLGHKVKIVNK